MNKDCAMARDLMPLVIDNVASEESREFVENHMAGCGECSAVYAEMKKDIPAKTEQEKGSEQEAFSRAAGKLKRKKRLRVLRNVLLGVLIGCIALFGGLVAFDRITQAREPVYYGFYSVYLSQLKSGDIAFTMDYHGSFDELGAMVKSAVEKDETTGEEKNVLYVYLEKYRLNRKTEYARQNKGFMTISAKELQECDEIRQGVPSEYRTIWTKNVKIDQASEQMEEYYYWENIDRQLWDRAYETPDGKGFFASHEMHICEDLITAKQFAVESTVPEWQPRTEPLFHGGEIDQRTINWLLSELQDYGIDIGDPTPYGIPQPYDEPHSAE